MLCYSIGAGISIAYSKWFGYVGIISPMFAVILQSLKLVPMTYSKIYWSSTLISWDERKSECAECEDCCKGGCCCRTWYIIGVMVLHAIIIIS